MGKARASVHAGSGLGMGLRAAGGARVLAPRYAKCCQQQLLLPGLASSCASCICTLLQLLQLRNLAQLLGLTSYSSCPSCQLPCHASQPAARTSCVDHAVASSSRRCYLAAWRAQRRSDRAGQNTCAQRASQAGGFRTGFSCVSEPCAAAAHACPCAAACLAALGRCPEGHGGPDVPTCPCNPKCPWVSPAVPKTC